MSEDLPEIIIDHSDDIEHHELLEPGGLQDDAESQCDFINSLFGNTAPSSEDDLITIIDATKRFQNLSPKQLEMIIERFGFFDEKPKSCAEITRKFDLSRGYVSRTLRTAYEKLLHASNNYSFYGEFLELKNR